MKDPCRLPPNEGKQVNEKDLRTTYCLILLVCETTEACLEMTSNVILE